MSRQYKSLADALLGGTLDKNVVNALVGTYGSGYQQYLHGADRQADPLIARGGQVQGGDPSYGLRINQQGPRAGSTYQTVEHGGDTYHVYYDPSGRRRVFKV